LSACLSGSGAFSALTLLVWCQEELLACKKFFLLLAYPDCPGKEATKRVSLSVLWGDGASLGAGLHKTLWIYHCEMLWLVIKNCWWY